MNKRVICLIALILAAVLLTGCAGLEDYQRLKDQYFGPRVSFSEMEYVRPDPDDFMDIQRRCTALAQEGTDLDALTDAIWDLYDEYDRFYTLYTLADIHYCRDMSDLYWQDEYAWCQEKSLEVDAGLDQLLYALAASDLREELESEKLFGAGYFDGYQGESLWDGELTQMLEEEAQLMGRYDELILELPGENSPEYEAAAMEIVELYAELVALRQKQAQWAGYDDYVSFAGAFYYSRDYTAREEKDYLDRVREELAPLYRQVCAMDEEELGYHRADESRTFDYLAGAAENMGGTVAEAFELMESAQLYDIAPGQNKSPASFEVYLWDYAQPFVFVNPEGSTYDALSFAHEFGHFCNDYASYGSGLNTDCAEVLSQGMEYLTLCYADDGERMRVMKMADSVCTYVEQAAYAAFEHAAYALSPEALTAENLVALYEEVTAGYGFDAYGYDGTELVGITHFFSYPCYVFSYIISNDAAMQIYQRELEKPGAGLRLYEKLLSADAGSFQEFLDEGGLESPFAEGRIAGVADTFCRTFGS